MNQRWGSDQNVNLTLTTNGPEYWGETTCIGNEPAWLRIDSGLGSITLTQIEASAIQKFRIDSGLGSITLSGRIQSPRWWLRIDSGLGSITLDPLQLFFGKGVVGVFG